MPKISPIERSLEGDHADDLVELGVAGEAVDQRGAVEQHARRQGAEDEILEARFGRPGVVALHGGDDVERQRLQFEADIEASSGRWPRP